MPGELYYGSNGGCLSTARQLIIGSIAVEAVIGPYPAMSDDSSNEHNLNVNPVDGKRWYDQDPALNRAMEQLRLSPDKYQAQIALNIIKIIVEHQIELHAQAVVAGAEKNSEGVDLVAPPMALTVEDVLAQARGTRNMQAYRRWYDMHETLSSAIQLLSDCPDDLQQRVIPSIALMIEQTLTGEGQGEQSQEPPAAG
jgi:hypothetical protein